MERLKPRKQLSKIGLDLDEGDPEFQLLTEEDIFFFLSFKAVFCFINPEYRLILMSSPLN
jgi:hypothetical protein